LIGSSPKRRTVTVDPTKQTVTMPGGGIRIVTQPRNLRGVNRISDTDWFVRGDSGAMRVSKGSDGSYRFAFTFPNGLNLSREQIALLSGRFRILRDPLMAKEWKVSDDQVEKLKQIDVGGGALQPSDTQRSAVRQLWDGYLKASDGSAKMDAQKKLVDKVDEIAKANLET